jgi:hypothetical protein
MIVDVSRLPLESEFGIVVYERLFGETLKAYFPSASRLPVDVFALCRSRGRRKEAQTSYAGWEDTRVACDQCEALLGPLT